VTSSASSITCSTGCPSRSHRATASNLWVEQCQIQCRVFQKRTELRAPIAFRGTNDIKPRCDSLDALTCGKSRCSRSGALRCLRSCESRISVLRRRARSERSSCLPKRSTGQGTVIRHIAPYRAGAFRLLHRNGIGRWNSLGATNSSLHDAVARASIPPICLLHTCAQRYSHEGPTGKAVSGPLHLAQLAAIAPEQMRKPPASGTERRRSPSALITG
jgi:hypothetical protein